MDKHKILELVYHYADEKLNKPDFKPGVSQVPVSGAVLYPEDVQEVADTLLEFWYTDWKKCATFKRRLCSVIGKKHCVLVNSGSSASLIAQTALLKRSKEKHVITTALGFPTTVYPIWQNGKVPIFIDIDARTFSPNWKQYYDAISHDAGILVFAHTLGFPFNEEWMLDFISMSNRSNFSIVDSCDALGAKIKLEQDYHHVGVCSSAMTLSFFPAHHITAGEGGAILTDNEELALNMEKLINWGRSCFPINTPIITLVGSKNIQDVAVGDWVLSHSGYFNRVNETFCRKYTGKICKIRAHGRPEIVATEDHLFLSNKDGTGFIDWHEAKTLKVGDQLFEAVPQWESDENQFEWSYLTDNCRINKSFVLPFDKDLFRLIGYWLSQGSLAKGLKGKSGYIENKYLNYRVDFAFNKNKSKIIDDLMSQMLRFFGCSGFIRQTRDSGGVTISFKSRKAYEFFLQFCSSGAFNKHIPYDVMGYEPEQLIHLVWGMILGDGSKSFQGYTLSSISYEMLQQARRILLQNHIIASEHIRTADKYKEAIVNGKLISQKHNLWTLSIYGLNAERLSILCDDDYVSRSKRRNINFTGDGAGVIHTIYSIKFEDVVDFDVYNIEVENDHSYHAWGVIAHNCYCLPGQSNTCGKRFEYDFPALPKGWDHKYTFTELGYNLKMTEFQAALGMSQIKHLDDFVKIRRDNFYWLLSAMTITNTNYDEYFDFVSVPDWSEPSPFGFPIIVKKSAPFTANELISFLEKHEIRTRRFFGGNLIRQPFIKDLPYINFDLSETDYVMENGFWIGVFPGLTKEHLDYVLEIFEKFFRERKLRL